MFPCVEDETFKCRLAFFKTASLRVKICANNKKRKLAVFHRGDLRMRFYIRELICRFDQPAVLFKLFEDYLNPESVYVRYCH